MFKSARVKLTIWYVLISLMVSFVFSGIIYTGVSAEVARFEEIQRVRYERRLMDDDLLPLMTDRKPIQLPPNPALIVETKHRILILLVVLNGLVGAGVSILGYILAGRTLNPIKNMVEQQTQFISDASHELKTPLTALKTTLEVYLRGKSRSVQEADEVARESLAEVEKLHQLSASLLELTTSNGQDQSNVTELVNSRQLINLAIKQVAVLAKKRRIMIKSEVEKTTVRGHLESLTRVVVILLDNAIKYSPTKSQIMVHGLVRKERLIIEVRDQGVGIESQDQTQIFNRFYRVDQARTKVRPDGYGLGLSIAAQIIKRHHGSLTVKSQIGQGSIFTIILPVS